MVAKNCDLALLAASACSFALIASFVILTLIFNEVHQHHHEQQVHHAHGYAQIEIDLGRCLASLSMC